MDLEQIKAEMARKPDAQLLVEWIAEQTTNATANFSRAAIGEATDAYFDAPED